MPGHQCRAIHQQTEPGDRHGHGGGANGFRHQMLAACRRTAERRQFLMLLKMLQQHRRRSQDQIDIFGICRIKQLFQRGAGAVERPYHHRPRLLLPAIDNPHGGAGRKCRRHHQLIALRRTGSQPCGQQQQREHFAHYPDPTKKYVCDPVHKY
ncbi:Uncharacterised protein [Klebsiella pneumoniae]|nr:Uncharacterised protein [Klebsiella pneumoniae]